MTESEDVNFNRVMAGLEEVAALVEVAVAASPLQPSGPSAPEGKDQEPPNQ